MKYEETIAAECRYGDIIAEIFEDAEILGEDSVADYYHGYAKVYARKNGHYIMYEWTYGSCSGCDDWEHRGLSYKEILKEVKRDMLKLNKQQFLNYLKNMKSEPEKGIYENLLIEQLAGLKGEMK
jgi:hypothetical protein